ncbi:GH36-type glycosyl hydrolase domain-containing protein [Candidatus Margulisiibacteriota bacterium]
MKYGHFDDKNKEYVITRPDTPLPWINYLGCEDYCALMSNTAGGYSFYKDAKELRLTRYRYNNIPMDRGGRYLYIKDNKTEDFWSVSWQPVLKDLDKYKYECRHGLGYTTIRSAYSGIATKTTYFVPLGESLEVWMLEVKNESKNPRELTITSFVEFCLWDALNDMTDYQYNLNIGETAYKDGTIYHLSRYRVEETFFAYFTCTNQKPHSFDSDRTAFLGTYGSLEKPKAVIDGKGSNSIAHGWAPVGSHTLKIKLAPKETKTLIFVLGYSEKKNDVHRVLKKFKTRAAVEKELRTLKTYWENGLNKYSVDSEDDDVNSMVNIWNQYQCRTTFNWSRSASYYEAGIGRGMGFRDSNQDTLGFSHQIPDKVRNRIVDLASTQFKEGNALHQYSPLTKKAISNEKNYSDDHLWLIISTANYVKESGDIGFLKKDVKFGNGGSASMYKHLAKAIDYTLKNLGPHGLPLMFFADWNDCLNLGGRKNRAESVLVGEMLVFAAKEMSELAEILGKTEDAKKYSKIAEKMTRTVNEKAWDGSWYIRGFTDDGKPLGSSKNKEGQIYLETQPWAVMSGVADNKRAAKCMDSVKKLLATKYGIMLLSPSYSKFHHELGSISVYPGGLKENGAIFCHPNPWAMIAECLLGRGDQAFEYYKAILPATKNKISEIHKVEPYIYCQMIAGHDSKSFGEGKNSWLTGTAAWNFVAISNWILGIRPHYNGLVIDPCIPSKWDGFQVRRYFRGSEYYITVRNPNKLSRGVKSIIVDGKKIKGNIAPIFKDNKEHHVEVKLEA